MRENAVRMREDKNARMREDTARGRECENARNCAIGAFVVPALFALARAPMGGGLHLEQVVQHSQERHSLLWGAFIVAGSRPRHCNRKFWAPGLKYFSKQIRWS